MLLLCAATLAYAQPFSVLVPCGTAAECSALMERLTATEPPPEPEPPADPDPEPPPVVTDTDLLGPAYADMRRDFLALEPEYTMEMRPGEGGLQSAFDDYGVYSSWGKPHQDNVQGYDTRCTNSMGTDAYCMTVVRSTNWARDWPCGRDPAEGQSIADCPECACTEPVEPGAATWWIGGRNRQNFIGPMLQMDDPRVHGADIRNGPANRFCVEVELGPLEHLSGDKPSARGADVLVHEDRAAPQLRSMQVNFGTYTSPFYSDTGTIDIELGGSFQGGGAHWYDQASGYDSRPHHRIYPVTDRVFLACMVDAPNNVRSGMRPPYYANPLATVVGDREDGQTDAYAFVPHITRAYMFTRLAQAVHPFNVKISRFVWAYERNDVQAMSGRGSVLGVQMSQTSGVVVFPVTVYNWAPEDRTYDITIQAWGIVTRIGDYARVRLWWDRDGDGAVSQGDQQLLGGGQVTLPADTDVPLLAVITDPHWHGERHGRRFSQVHFRLQEHDRMRGTHYSMRIWEGSEEEVARQAEILPTLVYPTEDHAYKTLAEWNQDKPGNKRLVRNSPDYRMALERMRAR